MGDYVDSSGQGRNFSPGGLARVEERLKNQPKGPAINIADLDKSKLFDKYCDITDGMGKSVMSHDAFIEAIKESESSYKELLKVICMTVQKWNRNFPLSGAESMQQAIHDKLKL